jgi:hypothetical protein
MLHQFIDELGGRHALRELPLCSELSKDGHQVPRLIDVLRLCVEERLDGSKIGLGPG